MTPIAAQLARVDGAAWDAYIEGRYDALAEGLYLALTFARFTANTTVVEAERSWSVWVDTGRWPRALSTQRRLSCWHIREYCTPVAAKVLYTMPDDAKLADVDQIYGLAPCKAAFGLSLAGFAKLPCLDTHIARAHGLDPRTVFRLTGNKQRDTDRYLALCQQVYPGAEDARLAQWTEYAELVPAFANGLHAPVIDRIVRAYQTARIEAAYG